MDWKRVLNQKLTAVNGGALTVGAICLGIAMFIVDDLCAKTAMVELDFAQNRFRFWLYKARENPLFWICLTATAFLIGIGGAYSVRGLIKWLTCGSVENGPKPDQKQ